MHGIVLKFFWCYRKDSESLPLICLLQFILRRPHEKDINNMV